MLWWPLLFHLQPNPHPPPTFNHPSTPPTGHLTSEGRAEGGNLYNNVAIAARAAQRAGAPRVMVVDWDAHAAKGTASVFEGDAGVMVISMHKSGG